MGGTLACRRGRRKGGALRGTPVHRETGSTLLSLPKRQPRANYSLNRSRRPQPGLPPKKVWPSATNPHSISLPSTRGTGLEREVAACPCRPLFKGPGPVSTPGSSSRPWARPFHLNKARWRPCSGRRVGCNHLALGSLVDHCKPHLRSSLQRPATRGLLPDERVGV